MTTAETEAALERGQRIAVLRERMDLSQLELAKRLDVHEMTVWRWEHRGASVMAELAVYGLWAQTRAP